MTIGEFCEAAAQYGMMTSQSVTSWGRTVGRNAGKGGVPQSGHLYYRAADFGPDTNLAGSELARARAVLGPAWEPTARPGDDARRELGRRLGLLVIIEGDHDHVQPLDWSRG